MPPVESTLQLRLYRPNYPIVALGLTVNYLLSKPAFANLPFGECSRILVGQINRQHYYFAVDSNNHIKGFMGWALTSKDKAEAWVESRERLSFEDSKQGECVILNAWAAESSDVHRFLVQETRKMFGDKQTLYFKRHYKDGRIRAVRLPVNGYVAGHIERAARPSRE